ncbi:MAG: hypothetical protein Q8N36_03705, partial [bacterium]|nr:hypothetical protein [bacterium]
YEQFEEMWVKTQEAHELKLQLEVMTRLVNQLSGKRSYVPLAELVAESGISWEDMQGDIDVEAEPK